MFPGFAILVDALEADIVDRRRKFNAGMLPSPSGPAVLVPVLARCLKRNADSNFYLNVVFQEAPFNAIIAGNQQAWLTQPRSQQSHGPY